MTENRISKQVQEYLEYKHSIGFKPKHEGSVLRSFVNYTLTNNYNGPLTKDVVLQWITSSNSSDKTGGRKIEVIRPFSKYASIYDAESEYISNLIFRNVHDRPAPYIYTEYEVIQLMKYCETLFSPDGIRAKTMEIIIGLLYVTGLRPSEPVHLLITDVDWDNGILHIRNTKFSKERFVPISKSVLQKLVEYKSWIDNKIGLRSLDDALFYNTDGKPMEYRVVSYAFQIISKCINDKPIGYKNIRLYDFRHTMAYNTLRKWAEQGIDCNANLHVLSTYLGHVKPEDTYWYLSATPEMLEICCLKYEKMFSGGDYE